jgi:hypothetical protein
MILHSSVSSPFAQMVALSTVHLDGRTVWLCFASLIAGLLNSVAGGGSFLSFPALLNLGVLPIQANATNTVALWPGQFTSIAAYWQDLAQNRHLIRYRGCYSSQPASSRHPRPSRVGFRLAVAVKPR